MSVYRGTFAQCFRHILHNSACYDLFMHEGIPKQSPKRENEQPDLSRRRFLVGGAALVGATLAGSYVYKEISGGDESITEEKPPFPSPEKTKDFELAQAKIRACVESIQKRPYME